ncbi:MAG: DEAD/DEAH box helicase [Lentisphaerae bacterium]|nr:DEAD/DEAH box helicase [Lentisphaerota bacterium]
MSKFETIQKSFEDAASVKDSAAIASACRNCVLDAVKLIFEVSKIPFSETASMLELLDSPVVTGYVDNTEVMNSLQYVRILGNNARHGSHIKKTEAELARSNTAFFLGFIRNKLYPEEHNAAYEKLPYMSEAATRRLYIDLYLQEAGWEVLKSENQIMPGKAGIEIRVEGMPNAEGIGFCDYVLFGKDGKPLAIVEAKKTSVSPEVGRHQVMLYGDCMEKQYGYRPVLYYTNGYEIKCVDGLYPDRQLYAFHTLTELELLIQRRARKDITDLRIREDITNRPYQKMAITNMCERLNLKFRRGLLVMATGTGKTRVAISLVDVLTRNQWVKNVLFLADRTSLVGQAHKNFAKLLPDQSFCVLSDSKLNKDLNARIMFSTYQTMINYVDGEEKQFSSGRFDLIIVDEAHRSIFNKYGSIFDYFDSLLIGLTATPKSEVDANTYRIFQCESGEPNFEYSLKEAVTEHYLVPYRVVNRTTKILDRGIKYDELSPEEKKHIEEAFAEEPPDMGYDVESAKIFRKVYNETTCDRVLQDLMKSGLKIESGDKLGKTIIFAYNHKHAELIVERFKKLYPSYGANYCQLVDNTVKYANDLILKFEEDPNFQIAVSVDMLDTGIDVPSVLNLVFFKPVKSKIKFVQMIGRGTRLCPGLFGPGKDKEHFLIFDYCGNFEYFSEHPETFDPAGSLSLTQRLFNIRLAILVELQKIEHQKIEFNRCYHEKLMEQLHGEIVKIRANSCRLQVRQEMAYVDKYYDRDIWSNLSEFNKKEIEVHLTYLLDADSGEKENVKLFDARMLEIEISLLLTGKTAKARKSVEVVRKIANYLLDKASVPQIMAKADQLKMLVSEQFWLEPTVEKLESLREDVRELMQFVTGDGNKKITLHIDDEVEDGKDIKDELVDIRTYRQKVMDYLAENSDNPAIQKIHKLEKINAEDLKDLEDILWHQLGTRDEYVAEAENKTLAVFIRSLIGLDQDAVNQKFGEFLNGNVLNSQQQEFVKAIIEYVRVNGNISKEDLFRDPFADYNVADLFGDKLSVVIEIINTVQGAVVAA